MYQHRGGGGGGWDTPSYKGSLIGLTMGQFELAKSIPDINIHLAGGFQPISYFLATTRAI